MTAGRRQSRGKERERQRDRGRDSEREREMTIGRGGDNERHADAVSLRAVRSLEIALRRRLT